MSRLEELIAELCPNGVEYKRVKEISRGIFRGAGIKRDEITSDGIPCVRYGEIYTTYGIWFDKCVSYTTLENVKSPKFFEYGDILFAITGENVKDIAKSTAYVGNEKCLAGGDILVLKHNQNPKFLSYVLSTTEACKQKCFGKSKNKVVHSNASSIGEILIPVPPLPIQEEIVKILDKFTARSQELSQALSQELVLRKKQYEYYKSVLLSFDDDVPRMALGEVGSVCMCKRILKSQTNGVSGVPFYKIGTFGKKADSFISKETYEEYREKYKFPKRGDVLISASGTIGRTVVYNGEPAYFQDSNIVWLDNDETKVLNSYLLYCYSLKPWKISEGGTIARLYNDNILNAIISVPPLAEQARIAAILDRFEALTNNLTSGLPAEIAARRKQYEYYRDKLLTFSPRQNIDE